MFDRTQLQAARRIVVKVGTSTLTHPNGKLNFSRIEGLVRELADAVNAGKQILLVSSGAVGAGMDRLGWKEKPKTIPAKQAAAAVGQGILMHTYEKLFAEYGQVVAQVLLTREDSVNRRRYANSRNTLLTLLNIGVIPIINENDAVSIDELKIGDNDTLSANVAAIVDADVLIILSDVEGVYSANPQTDPQARLLPEIADVTPEVEAMCGGAGTLRGTGGMLTKMAAARMAMNSGIVMVIASGSRDGAVQSILAGTPIGTLFPPRQNRLQFRKRWLAFGARIKGRLTVDRGCAQALLSNGSSLLAAGVKNVEGSFEQGSTVSIVNPDGWEIARGLVNYSTDDVRKIMGAHTHEIAEILGHKPYDEVVHRDNLVLLSRHETEESKC
ncbi:MAG: glutamate 5-kinase [Veillonellaceae bacterium]|nr:glutamate 5-kinase [Veillonellaceae bacterium]